MKILKIPVEFEIGQEVYLKTDPDQIKRMVVKYEVSNKDLIYAIQVGAESFTWHYGFEISDEKDMVLATTN